MIQYVTRELVLRLENPRKKSCFEMETLRLRLRPRFHSVSLTAILLEHSDVKERIGAPAILIVDDDLGFSWWVGALLSQAGYYTVPAMSARQAASLIRKLNLEVELAFLNPRLEGVPELAAQLGAARAALKIVLIRESGDVTPVSIRADATVERPEGSEEPSRQEWLRKLKRLVEQVKANRPILRREAGPRKLS
jgi:hypothetical protein